MGKRMTILLSALLIQCSTRVVSPTCAAYEPALNQYLEPYTNVVTAVEVKINGKDWKDWGNATNLASVDNPIFFRGRSTLRYQRCPAQICGQEIGEIILTKAQGISASESSHLESFRFNVDLPDSVVASLKKSKRGQLIYTPENILEYDQACQFKEEIIGILMEDDEYYGRYQLDTTKPSTFQITEFDPEQQIVVIKFNGTFQYDKTNVNQGFISKANRLYEPIINVQIHARLRYLRQNE